MTKSVNVTGYDHTRVYVSDMERSRAFYENLLDMKVYAENPRQESEGIGKIFGREGAAVQLVFGRIGGHIVELINVLGVDLDQPPAYYVGGSGFTLTVADIDAAYEVVQAAGVEGITEKVVVKGTKIFFIHDPDGMRIELIEYADGHHVTWPVVAKP